MSSYTERMLPLYNAKKNLPNPPSYMEDLKQLLKLDGLLEDEEDGDSIARNKKRD